MAGQSLEADASVLKVLRDSLLWLWEHYSEFRFFTERDVVWTIQRHLLDVIEQQALAFSVFNDFPIEPGARRALSVDLAILRPNERVALALEFKYEPDHRRGHGDEREIWPTKLSPSVVFWGAEGVLKDMERIKRWVNDGRAEAAFAIFIDEGGLFRSREPHPGAQWFDIQSGGNEDRRIPVLLSAAGATVADIV